MHYWLLLQTGPALSKLFRHHRRTPFRHMLQKTAVLMLDFSPFKRRIVTVLQCHPVAHLATDSPPLWPVIIALVSALIQVPAMPEKITL